VNFDAILCDYSLEERHTGFEVITAARSHDPGVPAVLLTGYATNETADEAAANNTGVMFKPIEIEEFLATTSKMLRRDNEPNKKNNQENNSTGPQGRTEDRNQQQRGRGRAQRRSPGGSVKT
jgi:DNA-binding NtrC family response regulator